MTHSILPRVVQRLQRTSQSPHCQADIPQRDGGMLSSDGSHLAARLSSLLQLNDAGEPIAVRWTLEGSVA